jgi:hypothetical protein
MDTLDLLIEKLPKDPRWWPLKNEECRLVSVDNYRGYPCISGVIFVNNFAYALQIAREDFPKSDVKTEWRIYDVNERKMAESKGLAEMLNGGIQ